jgi:hypothetical protein
VLTNSDNGDLLVAEIMRSIAAEYIGRIFSKRKTLIALDAKTQADYAGKYIRHSRTFSVSVEEGKLLLQLGSPKKYEMLAESETHFFIKESPLTIVFVKDAAGRVMEMTATFNGQEYRLKKV